MHLDVSKIRASVLSSVFLPFVFRDPQFLNILLMRSGGGNQNSKEKHRWGGGGVRERP